jgi:IclR family acetate operon transcriptional repressor
LGAAALNQIHHRDVAAPHAIDLVTQTSHTVTLSFAEGEEMVFSEMFELHDERVISKPAVLRIPVAATASGKIFLAHLRTPDDELRALVRRTPRFTDHTLADPEELVRQVHEARRRGYAESLGEFWPDSGAISAAACDFAGRPRVAVNVGFRLIEYGASGALDELRGHVLGPLLACVERISMQLGRRALPLLS